MNKTQIIAIVVGLLSLGLVLYSTGAADVLLTIVYLLMAG